MKIRIANPHDVPALTNLINVAFQVERFFIDNERISLNSVQDCMNNGRFLIMEDADAFVGCVYIKFHDDMAYLELLSIIPSRQRSGLGTQLIEEAENYCCKNGCQHIGLKIVNLREELMPFYRRRGYIPCGIEPFSNNTSTKMPCHFIQMKKPLACVTMHITAIIHPKEIL